MTITAIPFVLNRKSGLLAVEYDVNQNAAKSGFDLFAGNGFDISLCVGYPTMHASIESYDGTGYATACAWIQIVTRYEFDSLDAIEPARVVPEVDTHPTLVDLGVPFFAFGFPAKVYDAPCNNLNGLARLDWIADMFLVTLPSRANDDTVFSIASFRWGYLEYNLNDKRHVEIHPLVVTAPDCWNEYLSLLQARFPLWKFKKTDLGL